MTFSINLSKILPFEVDLSKNNDKLILRKQVMEGTISLESIILDLKSAFNIDEIFFKKSQTNEIEVFLNLNNSSDINIAEIKDLLFDIISSELPLTLFNNQTKKPLTYITPELLDIPLIGSIYFGVIDRGTNLLQVRSITGCPLNCPFCSVDEGPVSKSKVRDFIVDVDYLVQTYNYVVTEKKLKKAEAHLDAQGEPMSYPYLVELVQKLNESPNTKIISIQTNGWYLTKKLIDELASVGLSRVNLSINSLDLKLAKHLSGRGDYPLEKILENAEYIINSGISLLIAPLWIHGWNDEDIKDIIKFSLKINSENSKYPTLGIQNYLVHHEGRNIPNTKQKSFTEFYAELRKMEKELGATQLVLKQQMFDTFKSKMIDLTMKQNQLVKAEVVLPGRLENEFFAKANNRIIHISPANNLSIGKSVKLRITRNRHNIYFATLA
ncbi:MAG: radical SAM protein [Asgard group archaeon]|nr:radical SAM protein [Asgard group archaeon]